MSSKQPEQQTPAGDAMADPKASFETILAAARLTDPVIDAPDNRQFAVVPPGFSTQEITSPYRLPPYIHQSVTIDEADSLITYTNRFRDTRTVIVADIDRLTITSALDWHMHNQPAEGGEPLLPGPRKHMANFVLRESEEFKRWSEMEGDLHDQMAFAEFLDENAQDICTPEPAVMIEIARDLEATQGVVFKSSTRLQTGERSIQYETETHTRGDIKVPTQFTLEIPLFAGEEPVEIVASFRFRPRPDGLKLGFVWRRVEYRRLAEFQQIATRISEATGCPLVFGRLP